MIGRISAAVLIAAGLLAAQEPKSIRFSSAIAGKLLTKVDPVYPPKAAKAHLKGNVALSYVIDETGQVKDIKVITGHPLLAPAAVEALAKWIYSPTLVDSNPAAVNAKVTIKFPPEKEQ